MRQMHRRAPGRSPALTLALSAGLAALLLAGCTNGTLPTPNPGDDPDRAATELAAGLAKRDVSAVEFVATTGSAVNDQLTGLLRGMSTLKPAVTVTGVDRQGGSATATLMYTWSFPGVPQKLQYTSTAQLQDENGRWKTRWQPSIVHAQLDGGTRLSQRRLAARRGNLLGAGGEGIMVPRAVVRIGIDKPSVAADRLDSSAARLARLVGINARTYQRVVRAAGAQAFVEAIVFRAKDPDRPANQDVRAIPGALPIQGERVLAPSRDFARPIVGTVGEASKEIVAESKGAVVSGDQVGTTGLQRRYDEQLRGTPGVQVRLLPATGGGASASAPPGGASASPAVTPKPSGPASASPGPRSPVTLFESKPVAGRDLTITLSLPLQRLAEATLQDTPSAAAIVAVRPSTGAILAAANNAGTNSQSIATVGQAAPGSTFKVVSALALLRAGLKPTSPVTCPDTLTVDGRRFTNYSDYPSSSLGRIPLQTALAQSCNTAFIGQRGELGRRDLAQAAGSLGLGIDYDAGFPSFYGSVPATSSQTDEAATMIGQGRVLASPMAMAGVVASVQAGRTVVPNLVQGTTPESTGAPLTSAEAADLRRMMRAVVTEGSGRRLDDVPGPPVIAKTGTAEFGNDSPLKTHAWMVAAQDDLAVAVYVDRGQSGSRTAGPLLERFLRGAR